ncbi:hypothetical protein SMDB11_1097 [Serratia marcescens subsp. marcescens Db11]|uniref:Transposase n=1 Tax=Serratia marcescens subsp. marcescens Db11 TaxID=273526 RepID=A0ABC9IG17_SERMA|nr:hypothetical protein SMDB11_1097 [Serratia marcescens subsp. marcescens Db11]
MAICNHLIFKGVAKSAANAGLATHGRNYYSRQTPLKSVYYAPNNYNNPIVQQ